MAHYEIFREQLAMKYPAYGHALWVPNSEGPDSCVEVGDVGYIREGKFHRLYNALLPANHPSHRKLGAPRDHEPLIPNPSDHIKTSTLEAGHYCSRGVCVAAAESDVRASKPEDFSQVSFKCKRKQCGAALFLPTQTECQDTIARGDFGQWIIKHFGESLRFARRHGLGIDQTEDIVLVTGCHRTRSWANVAFLESQGEEPVSFEVKVAHTEDADINIDWQISPEQIRGAAVFSWGPSGKNPSENQCVFIRGFSVIRTPRKLPKRRDPVHTVLEYVAERAPECDMVLVHDDDLARIDEISDGIEHLQSDAMMRVLRKLQPKIEEVSFEKDVSCAEIAMFAEELQGWGKCSVTRKKRRERKGDLHSPDVQLPRILEYDPFYEPLFTHFQLDPLAQELESSPLVDPDAIPSHLYSYTNIYGFPATPVLVPPHHRTDLTPEPATTRLTSPVQPVVPFSEHPRGPMVPQKRYKPHTSSDQRRYVDEVHLEHSISFFMQNPDELGISLKDAMHGRYARLVARDEPMFIERGPSISVRINWPGFQPWSRQVPIKDFRNPPRPITRAKLAKNVAKSVYRFITEHKVRDMEEDGDPAWLVGPGKIDVFDLVLIRLDHVSKGSWQVQLQLSKPRS